MTFSPLRDQPHYIYRVDEQVGDILEAAERCYPGVLAYGHYNHSRKWNRLTKLEGAPPEPFHYFHIFVPLNCAWLFEDFVGEYVTPKVEHAINVENIFAWPDDPDALETMVKYGRELARRYAAEGELRDFVPDMMTDYQARGVYWAATRPWSKLVYPCGCLAGDTVLVVNRCGKATRMRLDELVRKFNGGTSRGKAWSDAPTRVQSMDKDGYRVLNTVEAAVCSGEKEVFEVITADGKKIKATKDHRFWTNDRWVRLQHLCVGDEVAVMWTKGKRAWPARLRKETKKHDKTYLREAKSGVENHPFASKWWCGRDNRENATVYVHRIVAEARLNNLAYDDFLDRICKGRLAGLELLDPKVWHVHHKDHNIKNNDPSNLDVLTAAQHQREHGDWHRVTPRREFVEIVSIASVGVEKTYDLSMAAPLHNFIANDFVVHNSGKTLTAIMSALTRHGPVAIIAPAKARRVWWDQVQEYTHCVPLRVVPDGQRRKGDQTIPEYVAECHAAGVRPWVIMGAQSLPDYVDRLVDVQPRTLIYDELHTFGQPKRWVAIHQSDGSVEFEKRKTSTNTRETRAVAAMEASRMECLQLRVGLTATPLDDGRPRRLWSQLDLLAPGAYSMGYGAFAKRYCGAQEGQWGGLDDKGSSNIPELKARASYLMQEVTHTESHGQLPPTRVQVVWLEHGDQNRPVAFRKIINAAEKQAAKTHSVFDRERALEANLMEAASRKRRYIIEEVLEGLSGGGKVVLFTARRQDCEDWASVVHKALQKAVKRGQYHGVMPTLWWGHGGVDDREREDMVSEFRSSKGPCVLIATGQAFGESVDGLQTADLAIFAMLPWRPGDFEQWKGRFDRIGGSPTLLKVVLAKGTYDERVAGLLADKIAPIKEFLAAEQYQGLDTKLLGIDDHEKMRAGLLAMLFNPEGE